jgi:hypothetical protein
VIAAYEMQPRPGGAHGIEGTEQLLVPVQPEVRISEPEIEDITQQDQIGGAAGEVEKRQESREAVPLGGVGTKMEMAVGDEQHGRFATVAHVTIFV